MIRFIERKDIDDLKWDDCIRNAFNGNLYGFSWFLDIVADDWNALVESDYERVFPLVTRKKFNLSYIYQPFFTQQLGLYSKSHLNSGILSEFIHYIPSYYRWIEINLNTHNKADEREFKLIPQRNHELDLINSYDKVRDGYSENLVRNLKKAGRSGLSLHKNLRPEEIISIFRLNRGKEIRHLHEKDYQRLNRIAYTCLHKGMAEVRGVYNPQNELVAGAFFIIANRKAVFLFSGLTEMGRNSGAMPFLIDSYIRDHTGKHLTFDFDGSNDPNLARFYKSFGSKELTYKRLIVNRLPVTLSLVSGIYRKIRCYH
jgi:hypothetical protein